MSEHASYIEVPEEILQHGEKALICLDCRNVLVVLPDGLVFVGRVIARGDQ